MERMYTTAQVQKETGIKRSMIARWCRAGKFPGAKRIGKSWWLPETGVHLLLEVPRGQ